MCGCPWDHCSAFLLSPAGRRHPDSACAWTTVSLAAAASQLSRPTRVCLALALAPCANTLLRAGTLLFVLADFTAWVHSSYKNAKEGRGQGGLHHEGTRGQVVRRSSEHVGAQRGRSLAGCWRRVVTAGQCVPGVRVTTPTLPDLPATFAAGWGLGKW